MVLVQYGSCDVIPEATGNFSRLPSSAEPVLSQLGARRVAVVVSLKPLAGTRQSPPLGIWKVLGAEGR